MYKYSETSKVLLKMYYVQCNFRQIKFLLFMLDTPHPHGKSEQCHKICIYEAVGT